jgi:hypothetical protein
MDFLCQDLMADPYLFTTFFFPAELILWNCGSGRGEEPSGGDVLRLIQIRLATASFAKISPTCQDKSLANAKVDGTATFFPIHFLFDGNSSFV